MECEVKHVCPVCGYEDLYEPPYDAEGWGSFEICPCCGFQFGYDDDPDKEEGIAGWRHEWVEKGRPWFSRSRLPSEN